MSATSRLAVSRLTAHERAWLLQIFAAILPAERAGLPALTDGDHTEFFRILEEAPGPTFLPGLRVMLHALSALPLAYAGYRRPFFALSLEQQQRFLEQLAREEGYLARQLVATMKILTGFAYFESPTVRGRFDLRDLAAPEASR